MLYRKYYKIIIDYLLSLNACEGIAENIVQDIFSSIWEHRDRFKADSVFKTYICSIARNILLKTDQFRAKPICFVCGESLEYIEDSSGHKSDNFKFEQIQIVRESVCRLTAKQKRAVILFYYKKKTLGKAAKLSSCSLPAFASRLHRAKVNLKSIFENSIM